MLRPYPRERLQPSLLDRLSDGLAPILSQLHQDRAALGGLLDETQLAALNGLLEDKRFEDRPPSTQELAAFANLSADAKAVLDDVLKLQGMHRQELHRGVMLSEAELRAAVLRDLRSLLNTTAANTQQDPPQPTTPEAVLSRFPTVLASVLNYGVPALAGHIRTKEDFFELARQIERAVEQFEPRIRQVRVRPAEALAPDPAQPASPLDLVIEGELWGYPISEHLLVHTVLDLDAGRIEITGQERVV